jgi:hypothetical protein
MKKMSTLFRIEYEGKGKNRRAILYPEVRPENEWVIKGEGIATRKYDGTATAIINGEFYKRYDAKNGKPVPEGAIPCQPEPDPITGHFPCWVKVSDRPEDKYILEAYNNVKSRLSEGEELPDGTYEAIGPKINGNPENVEEHMLIRHGFTAYLGIDRTFDGIKKFLEDNEIEGIVFHRENGDMCKIRRKDFGLEWPIRK